MRFYNRLGRFYYFIDCLLMPSKKKLINKISNMQGVTVLDVGMGQAWWWTQVQSKELKMVGIDSSYSMVDQVKKRFPDRTVLLCDADQITLSNESIDVAVIAHVLSVVKSPGKVMNEIYRVLKPGGLLVIINHDSEGFGLLDRFLGLFSDVVKVSLPFYLKDIIDETQFKKMEMETMGRFSYFKWITLQKV